MNENISEPRISLFKSEQRTLPPSASRLPADAVCRKNAQSSLRPKPGSSYEVQHLKNTDHINGIGKCYSKIRALASKNQGRIPRKTLPPAAFRPSNPCPAPFEPPSPSETIRPFSQKTASRHHDALSPGQTAASPRIKRGKPSTPARPFPYGICGTPIFRAPFPIPASAVPPCRRAACP